MPTGLRKYNQNHRATKPIVGPNAAVHDVHGQKPRVVFAGVPELEEWFAFK